MEAPETIEVLRWELTGESRIEIEHGGSTVKNGNAWVFVNQYMNEAELRKLAETATLAADHLGKHKRT